MIERLDKTDRTWKPSNFNTLVGQIQKNGTKTIGSSSDEKYEFVHIPAHTKGREIFRSPKDKNDA